MRTSWSADALFIEQEVGLTYLSLLPDQAQVVTIEATLQLKDASFLTNFIYNFSQKMNSCDGFSFINGTWPQFAYKR